MKLQQSSPELKMYRLLVLTGLFCLFGDAELFLENANNAVETPGASTLPVAFSAALTTTSTINAQQNVIFDKVITNVGNGYNKSSGKFTAPMKGLYFVSVTLFNFYHVSPTMELVQNDQNVVDLYLDGSGHQNSGMSQTLVLQLNKGDTISVRGKTDAGKLSGSSGQPTGTYNTFSGYCLTYME